MSYFPELIDAVGRQQLRFQGTSDILFWPKEPGLGNIQVDASPAPTFALYAFGTMAGGITAAGGTITPDNSAGYSKLVATITASGPLFQINQPNYWILWTYSYGGKVRTAETIVDVVRDPWLPYVSLNQLVEECADMQRRCSALAKRLDPSGTVLTPEKYAAIVAGKAWSDVWAWLRVQVEALANRFVPSLIVDREGLMPVIIAQAIHRVYVAEGEALDSVTGKLAAEWQMKARARFDSLPPLAFAIGDQRAPVDTVQGFSVIRAGRSWG